MILCTECCHCKRTFVYIVCCACFDFVQRGSIYLQVCFFPAVLEPGTSDWHPAKVLTTTSKILTSKILTSKTLSHFVTSYDICECTSYCYNNSERAGYFIQHFRVRVSLIHHQHSESVGFLLRNCYFVTPIVISLQDGRDSASECRCGGGGVDRKCGVHAPAFRKSLWPVLAEQSRFFLLLDESGDRRKVG